MKLSHISKTYYNKNNTVKALRDINIEFDSTGLVVILGPSGCGKTTLLNIISGDDTSFEGEKIDTCSLSYLTQDVDLFESMTVFENLLIVNEDKKLIQSYHLFLLLRKVTVKRCRKFWISILLLNRPGQYEAL